MLAGQTWRASDGHEIMLFPFDEMYITQGEAPAHGGTLCMDFVGWSNMTGQINVYPYYAPCSCTCVAKGSEGDWVVFNSDDKVWCADGVLRYVAWQQGHDYTPCNVGDHFNQGDLIGHTGERGKARGDHCHYNTVDGHYDGWDSSHSESQLKNSMHIYDCCYVNDTILYHPLSYPWKLYDGPAPTPTYVRKDRFPWVLYARKLRNKRVYHKKR